MTEGTEVVHLLDVDPDLARDLDRAHEVEARERIVARAEVIDAGTRRGRWGPRDSRGCAAFMIVEGLVLREVHLGRGRSAELLGQSDLIRPWNFDGAVALPVPATVEWTILLPSRVALVDVGVLQRAQPWPAITAALIARGVFRAQTLATHQAIDQLSRIDHRLVLLFWHLAERWGRVTPEGVVVKLPLTHEVLARIVGARRPSVTTAIGDLTERGLLSRRSDRAWVIPHGSEDEARAVLTTERERTDVA